MSYALDENLSRTPVPRDVKRAVVNSLWKKDHTEQQFDDVAASLEPFFRYYEDQCRHAQTSAKSHREILGIIEFIRNGNETRATLKQKLESLNGHAKPSDFGRQTDASIALAVRLWLMVNVGSIGPSLTPGYTQVNWADGNIKELVSKNFSPEHELNTTVKLSKIFNACNLQRIAGIRVSWTSNLADHLSMRDDDTRIVIFHHATFLECHHTSNVSGPFPADFLDETLRTLSLLIPPNDTQTSKWFNEKQKQFNLDPKAGSCRHLNSAARQIENFKYWRDRLVILKQAFDESEPKTVKQWWNDDRKRVQWYTFWVAALVLVLTVLFGLIQSVSGVVQAWAAVKALP
jgi:hypothetical protein